MSDMNSLLLYTAPDGAVKVDVFFREETVWLAQKTLAELFGVKVPAILPARVIWRRRPSERSVWKRGSPDGQNVSNPRQIFHRRALGLHRGPSLRELRVAGNETMTKEATEIEVEVLEIDGVAPVTKSATAEESPQPGGDWQDWRQWQGRVRRLDSRWWPLWVFLGIIALALLLTVGLVLGVVFVIIRLCGKVIRALVG